MYALDLTARSLNRSRRSR